MTGNASTVAGDYAAFGRGDIPAILDVLADDVAWEEWPDNFAQRAGHPLMRPLHGAADVVEFFTAVGDCTMHDFQVLDVIGDGRQVVVSVAIDISLPGGGRLADEEPHLWTFDDAGKVVRLRHYVDTAKHIAAAGGEDTTAS